MAQLWRTVGVRTSSRRGPRLRRAALRAQAVGRFIAERALPQPFSSSDGDCIGAAVEARVCSTPGQMPDDPEPLTGCDIVTLPIGVLAIRDRASGQIMHCGTGPAVEPDEIYVGPSRLAARLSEGGPALVLFDVGLGAASNALAAWRVSEAAAAQARRLEIVSFDRDLIALELALLPGNAASFGLDGGAAQAAARALIATGRFETPRTFWRLALGDFPQQLALEPPARADIVFWDMYSARTNPLLWTVGMFQKLRLACADGATLHTTSAATSARTALLLGGFAVGRSGGTGNRGETTIACTHHQGLEQPLDARWLQRLGRSSAAFPSDVSDEVDPRAAALARVRGLPQFL